jgi:hypothetical protein
MILCTTNIFCESNGAILFMHQMQKKFECIAYQIL